MVNGSGDPFCNIAVTSSSFFEFPVTKVMVVMALVRTAAAARRVLRSMHLAVLSRSDGFQRGGVDDGRNPPPQAVVALGTAFYAWPPAAY